MLGPVPRPPVPRFHAVVHMHAEPRINAVLGARRGRRVFSHCLPSRTLSSFAWAVRRSKPVHAGCDRVPSGWSGDGERLDACQVVDAAEVALGNEALNKAVDGGASPEA